MVIRNQMRGMGEIDNFHQNSRDNYVEKDNETK